MSPVRLCGYQPQYFPRLHYFARILDAEIFKVSDAVQYVRRHVYATAEGRGKTDVSYQSHTVIKSAHGPQRLGLPILHDGKVPIFQTKLDYHWPWVHDHSQAILLSYSKARFGPRIVSQASDLLQVSYQSLADLSLATILWALSRILDMTELPRGSIALDHLNRRLAEPHPFRLKRIIIASQAPLPPPQDFPDATEWIIAFCRQYGADEYYYGGTAAAAYLDLDRLIKAGITPVIQDWKCQEYSQRYPQAGFIPNLSIIDLLANEDRTRVVQILQGA
ncbi:MAG: WbqC family protein [Candidatus Kerfeldbacteria bacterium]|nr:WbqC family protein [Candidatus Kerfeldbacteria bacterium]